MQERSLKKRMKEEKRTKRPPSPPGSVDLLDPGNQNRNRVDARVEEFDLNVPPLENAALVSSNDITLIELRNGKAVYASSRKVKMRIPRKNVNDKHLNLGRCIRENPLVRIRPKGPLCGYVSRMLKQRTEKSLGFLMQCQGLIKGMTFETEFIYLAAVPYIKHAAGMVTCYRTPSLGATRLILQQIIRCNSNFPWRRLRINDPDSYTMY
jgi:hypothetical protein